MILFDSIELNITLRDLLKASYILMICSRNPISLIKLLHILCRKKGISISFGWTRFTFSVVHHITDTYLKTLYYKKKIRFRQVTKNIESYHTQSMKINTVQDILMDGLVLMEPKLEKSQCWIVPLLITKHAPCWSNVSYKIVLVT